ncbi:head completion/stabilization protein [Pseudomonas plecoglossicida]|uniref:Phage head protein n=1 Tax=Pseudomonas plecoglossicida TaxID=70775 RepID=A0AAD0R032_PSEDL|nr:head completion/stabilization protein [Pseudomonas plecoglossicida]AXM98799.1 phage head protein [Pseudomonas plecoglossicida]QLB54946.1 head completion/stabilization protein [Pseudomonas plecoglossicida]GLR37980.1 hypothetical protein GCM10011247_33780 [Pseudomonas plecoglossicida]
MSKEPVSVTCVLRYPDSHDPFWPRMALPAMRARLTLGPEVSDARLALAVRCAAVTAANEFASWRLALRRRGYKRLGDVAGHACGRALTVCYVRFVEGAVLQSLYTHGVRPDRADGGSHE